MAYEVAAPKYLCVAQAIEGRIEGGSYPPGSLIPSEHQLVQSFGISRPTVVRALDLLKRDGWLESRQGYGTIVRGRPEVLMPGERRGRVALERAEADIPGRVLDAGRAPAPPRVASVLGIPRGTEVLVRRLLVERDGEPVELTTSYFPLALAERTELAERGPLAEGLRAHLEARTKTRYDHVLERISARLPDDKEAALLAVTGGSPMLSILVVACDASGQAVHVMDVLLPADRQELEDTYRLD